MSASASPHVKPRNLPPSGGGGSQKWVNDLHTHGTSLVKYSQISSNELNLNEEDLENARLALAWVGKYLPKLWD